MSQIVYRANLSAKAFPFLSDFQGRTVIVPGPDNTVNRSLVSTQDLDRDVGVPILYYCHNVMAGSYGFHSVGYDTQIVGGAPSTQYSQVRLIRANRVSSTVEGSRFYFLPSIGGGFHAWFGLGDTSYHYIVGGGSPAPIITASTVVTYATVQGITYIYFSNIGCYKFDRATNALIPVTLTALTPAVILGITSYQGYLIAYDTSSIYWSSVLDIDYTTNTIDFTPSLLTGAGNLKPEGTRADITFVMAATFGIAIYTASNIVSAVYSGNARYPFSLREIVSSGGCSSQNLVSYDANTGNQYAYTTSGLQMVTATATQTQMPEITDFLAGSEFEDFDEATLTFSRTTLTLPLKKKITAVADRYLIFSYGINELTHAIIYDMTQRRYGKLKFTHVDCFEYEYLDPTLSDAPRRSIGFLKSNLGIYTLNPSVTLASSAGVALFGKFQYVRSRNLSMEEVAFQSVQPGQTCSCYDLTSLQGDTLYTTQIFTGYKVSLTSETQQIYKFHNTGVNHSILIVGGFSLSSLQLTFHINGRR